MAEQEYNEGSVHIPLVIYNAMRDELDQRRKTTLTHKEFINSFRLGLLDIIDKCKIAGVDLSELYAHFKDIDVIPAKSVYVIKNEENGNQEIKIVYEKNSTRSNDDRHSPQ